MKAQEIIDEIKHKEQKKKIYREALAKYAEQQLAERIAWRAD